MVCGSRTPASAMARRWCGRRIGSVISPSAGKARYGVTGPKSSRRTIRFVHYDERGNGLSDWDSPEFSVDAFVHDLEAVVDALGLDRFVLIGSSKGGPTSIAYAARHPERVSHLVLYGTFAQGWRTKGDGAEVERHEAMIALTRRGWAQDNPAVRQILTTLFLPDATLEEMGWFNDLQRISSSAENAARLLQSLGDVDVLDLLPGIAAPTLVLHCRDDAAVPFRQGRLIASRIPGARFVALESRNHVLLPRDPAWATVVSEVRQFLACGVGAVDDLSPPSSAIDERRPSSRLGLQRMGLHGGNHLLGFSSPSRACARNSTASPAG